MKEISFNKFECCGAKLPNKFQFCPVCGGTVPRKELTEERQCLAEIERQQKFHWRVIENDDGNQKRAKAIERRKRMYGWLNRFKAIIERSMEK